MFSIKSALLSVLRADRPNGSSAVFNDPVVFQVSSGPRQLVCQLRKTGTTFVWKVDNLVRKLKITDNAGKNLIVATRAAQIFKG